MTSNIDLHEVSGALVTAVDGVSIGTVRHVYLNDSTGTPQWVHVSLGERPDSARFAPLDGARMQGGALVLAIAAAAVQGAPAISDDGHLEPTDEEELYGYYGQWLDSGEPGATADRAMLRSEEQLHVGTEQHTTGIARIRKRVVTEDVRQTVRVSHEELQTLREPITDAAVLPAGVIEEKEYEIILSEERLVVSKEIVPVERVLIRKHVVTEDQQINETLRREQIDDVDIGVPDVPASGVDDDR